MSHDAYDPDSDISRYLQTPPLESHLLTAPAVASHVTAPEDVPAVHQTPLNANPASLGFPAPTTNEVVENHQAALTTMDVQPPAQAYGFPEDPVLARIDALPSFDAIFDDIVLPNLENMSLYDQFMDDRDDVVRVDEALIKNLEDQSDTDIGNAAAEHTVPPIEEDLNFVPFVRGQLDCSNCRSVRDVLHESGKITNCADYSYLHV